MRQLAIAAMLVAFAGAATGQEVTRIATEGAYEPFNYIDQATGELTGFEIDLGHELCRRAELTCEFVQNDWDTLIPNLQSGNFDAFMAGMTITDERAEVIAFSDEYTRPTMAAYLAASPDANIGEGAVIAAQTATLQAAYIADQPGNILLEFATPDETVAAVRNGEADAVFADKDYLVPVAEDSDGVLVMLDHDIEIGRGMGIGMRKSDVELKAKFDAAIQSMKEDGSLNELIATELGPDVEQF